MITADIIVIIAFVACIVLGSMFGFGKALRLFTGGAFGVVISIVICYFLFGVVLSWGFVQTLLNKFTTALQDNGSWFCNFLLTIRIDLIVFALVLFFIVQMLRRLVVYIIAHVLETDNKFISVLNRILGVVFLIAFAIVLMLIVFQIIAWVSGTDGGFYNSVQGSVFGLDKMFVDNPLNAVFESIRAPFSGGSTGE